MTVASQTAAATLSANGVTTVFPFSFKVLDEDDIKVITVDAGVETEVDQDDYTVTLSGSGGGTVTFDSAPANGLTVFIRSDATYGQGYTIRDQGGYNPVTNEAAIDALAILLQELKYDVDHAIKLPESEAGGDALTRLLGSSARAGMVIGFDGSGDLALLDASGLGGGGGGGGGGTSSPLTTKGDLWAYSTTDARLAVGSNGQILIADSTASRGVKWGTPTAQAILETGGPTTLSVGSIPSGYLLKRVGSTVVGLDPATLGGGGGGSTSPLTTKGDLWGFSSVDARLAVGSNGQILIADSTASLGVKWGAVAATKLIETGGPTTLDLASIPDTYVLKRSGSTVIGIDPTVLLPIGGATDSAAIRLNAATSAIPNTTITKLPFDTVEHDDGGLTDIANNQMKIPSGKSGTYQINVHATLDPGATGVRECYLYHNSTLIAADAQALPPGGDTIQFSMCRIRKLADNDTITVKLYQSSGGSLNVLGGDQFSCVLSIAHLLQVATGSSGGWTDDGGMVHLATDTDLLRVGTTANEPSLETGYTNQWRYARDQDGDGMGNGGNLLFLVTNQSDHAEAKTSILASNDVGVGASLTSFSSGLSGDLQGFLANDFGLIANSCHDFDPDPVPRMVIASGLYPIVFMTTSAERARFEPTYGALLHGTDTPNDAQHNAVQIYKSVNDYHRLYVANASSGANASGGITFANNTPHYAEMGVTSTGYTPGDRDADCLFFQSDTMVGGINIVCSNSAPIKFKTNGNNVRFQIDGDGKLGFYGHATSALQTGVAVTAAAIHAALVNLGLITA